MKNRIAAIVFMVLFASSCLNALTQNEQDQQAAVVNDLYNRAHLICNGLEFAYVAGQHVQQEQYRRDLRGLIAQAQLMLTDQAGGLAVDIQGDLLEFIQFYENFLREFISRSSRNRRPSQEIRDNLRERGRALNLFPLPVAADQLISR